MRNRDGRELPREWATERRWDAARPLPTRWVLPDGGPPRRPAGDRPLDVCDALRRVCGDIAGRCPEFAHVDISRVLVSFTPSRNRSRFGLQARVTPMRFRDGGLLRRVRGVVYGVERYFVDGREIKYVVTFCLPRFLDQPFSEKVSTILHELYHVGPAFDGDLRRHPGRYAVHSHSKSSYDARMADFAKNYLAGHPEPDLFDFLRVGYADLWRRHGGVYGTVVPRPKLLPVSGCRSPAELAAANRRADR